jgi:hypothetical protein
VGNIPVLTPNEVIAILIKLGFIEVRQRGSQKQFCSVKSPKTLASRSMSCLSTDQPGSQHGRCAMKPLSAGYVRRQTEIHRGESRSD